MSDSPMAVILLAVGCISCLLGIASRSNPYTDVIDGAVLIGAILIVGGLLCGIAANIRKRLDRILNEIRKRGRKD